jgi:hypothetical protein
MIECTHALTELCFCLPRPAPHVGSRVEKTWRSDPWRCTCAVKPYKRHKDAIACQPAEDVEAFRVAHGLKDAGHARALRYIEGFR